MALPNEHDPHAERLALVAAREAAAWREYLSALRADAAGQARAESFAWRRLKRQLAELAAERRRAEFLLERGPADHRQTLSRAS